MEKMEQKDPRTPVCHRGPWDQCLHRERPFAAVFGRVCPDAIAGLRGRESDLNQFGKICACSDEG